VENQSRNWDVKHRQEWDIHIFLQKQGENKRNLIQNTSGYGQKKPAGIQLLHNEIAKLREDSTIRALPDVIGYWELLRNAFFSSFLVLQFIIVYHSVSTIIHYLSEE